MLISRSAQTLLSVGNERMVIPMAEIKPFRGVRFTSRAGEMDDLLCPPYDIINEQQRSEYLEKNPNNIVKIELPVAEEGVADRYQAAAQCLDDWMKNGILARDPKPSLYIYEEQYTIHGETKSVRGIVSLVKIEEFEKGVIMPHEFTLSKPKQDRLNLIQATQSNISTIYSLYSDEDARTTGKLELLTERKPDVEAAEGKCIHRLWVVDDPIEITAICRDFEKRHLYIADGHHRYETSLKYRNMCRENGAPEGAPCDYVMMLLVNMDDNQFSLFPTHRMVNHVENFDVENFLKGIEVNFCVDRHQGVSSIKPTLAEYYQQGRKVTAWYVGDDTWYLLKLRSSSNAMEEIMPDCSKALKNLDISILHQLVIDRVMHSNNEDCVTYTRSFTEAIAAVDEGKCKCCFILNPTRIQDIKDIVDANEKMPQKSTYFYPKPTTGLVMNVYE